MNGVTPIRTDLKRYEHVIGSMLGFGESTIPTRHGKKILHMAAGGGANTQTNIMITIDDTIMTTFHILAPPRLLSLLRE